MLCLTWSHFSRRWRALALVGSSTWTLAFSLVHLFVAYCKFGSAAHDIGRQIIERGWKQIVSCHQALNIEWDELMLGNLGWIEKRVQNDLTFEISALHWFSERDLKGHERWDKLTSFFKFSIISERLRWRNKESKRYLRTYLTIDVFFKFLLQLLTIVLCLSWWYISMCYMSISVFIAWRLYDLGQVFVLNCGFLWIWVMGFGCRC